MNKRVVLKQKPDNFWMSREVRIYSFTDFDAERKPEVHLATEPFSYTMRPDQF